MRVAGTTRCCSLDPREERLLSRMARDQRPPPPPSAGGEFSGAGSPEEASTERFGRGAPRSGSVWGVGDLRGFSFSRNYAADLYSLAWERAVQNKPLGLDLAAPAEEEEEEEEEGVVGAEDGGEKEEGELEEGEIEFGSEAVAEISVDEPEKELEVVEEEEEGMGEEMGDFDRQVSLILEELETVTEEEVEKSFEEVCARLRKSFENLKPMFSETRVPVINALVQQAFMGIQTVHSVVSSERSKDVEQNKNLFLRLLIHIKNQYHTLLIPEQLSEIDTMVRSLVFLDKDQGLHAGNGGVTNSSASIAGKPDVSSHGLASLEKPQTHSGVFNANLEPIRTPRIKAEFSPLLDLHAAYDESSLPSPTRENSLPLPIQEPIGVVTGAANSTQPLTHMNIEAVVSTLHPYVTDPLKAVSSYQQKYGQTSVFSCNQLPSPTPSEESNEGDKNDLNGEVSSYSATLNARPLNPPNSSQPGSNAMFAHSVSEHHKPSVNTAGSLGSLSKPVTKATAKSRDPRLRLTSTEASGAPNSNRKLMPVESNAAKNGPLGEIMNTRKNKASHELVLDEHSYKKQRNNNAGPRNMPVVPGRGGWLEDGSFVTHQQSDKSLSNVNVQLDTSKPKNGEIGPFYAEKKQDVNSTTNASNSGLVQNSSAINAAALLKDLKDNTAVNPTMLIQLLQQSLAAETQQKILDPTHFASGSRLPGKVPTLNNASMKSSEVNQKPAGRPQSPAQPASTLSIPNQQNHLNDVGRIRMKPRDPRRILHNNMIQKSENPVSEQINTNGTLSLDSHNDKDNLKVHEHGELAQLTGLPQPASLPDTARKFTNNLNNLPDIMSSSQLTSTSAPVLQSNSQLIPNKINKVDMMPATAETSNQKSASGPSCEVVPSSASQSPNPWGDMDHLLHGYDDQQKAAIQRERVRRIEEQNKMFAARKLCLVLDLDHTLLNSAKFAEVDQVHDEILRKKEEVDREKPQRHLFRLLHMGMWTKLRPGIWNFLEKASKLYELHLYTMGNKLYATEMAKVLDPTGALFAGRVISRGDDGDFVDGDDRVPKSKDLDGVLGMESAVVIIDDSVRVWPHNKLNLIVVERYTYFPCSRRQFGLLGPSLLEIDHDERPEDGSLASSLAVIERIHQNFFSHRSLNDVDVRNILAAEQRKILGGCKIVFSRIFPVGEANPQLHPLWVTAEQFGAVCTNQIDEHVTHVVANSLGTDKVNWALSTGRFVVQPGWVEASALLYRRANEHDFLVKQ